MTNGSGRAKPPYHKLRQSTSRSRSFLGSPSLNHTVNLRGQNVEVRSAALPQKYVTGGHGLGLPRSFSIVCLLLHMRIPCLCYNAGGIAHPNTRLHRNAPPCPRKQISAQMRFPSSPLEFLSGVTSGRMHCSRHSWRPVCSLYPGKDTL